MADTPGADRAIVDGWLVQVADLPDGWLGADGDADFYRRSLIDFAGFPTFFVEWRATTDNPSELLDLSAVPAVLVAGGNGAGFYHTTMTDGRTQLFRSTTFPLVFVDLDPHIPHTYRLELQTDRLYTWSIDGNVVDTGEPQGAYPDPTARLTWGVRRTYVDATTRWDYIRFGTIPEAGSGDFDSDGGRDLRDFYFFAECLRNGGAGTNAAPSCTWADLDADGDADLLDFAEFQTAFEPGD